MIGMMYLVLTAMLALNVSKEAVDAFKKVDKGLTKTIANYAAKNAVIYETFEAKAAENAQKFGPARDNANIVKQRSDELFNYMQDIKIEIIEKSEGKDSPAIRGKTIVIDSVLKRIDDNNIPSEVLIGANFQGKAFGLKSLIASYRDDMIGMINGKDPGIEESLTKIFDTADGLDKSGEKERWETLNFQTLPLVAVITILSKMQVDVRNAETDMLNFLYSQIEARSFKFNRLVPMVQSTSNYVMQGGEYDARVFFSAIDTTQAPRITVGQVRTTTNADGSKKYEMVGDYTTLPLDETGKGIYKVRATTIGPKSWGGLISLKAPDGTDLAFPFEERYAVGAQSVVISPTAMNVLYLGIDNPIDISVPGVGQDRIRATMNNGTIGKGKAQNSKGPPFAGDWIAKPAVEGQNAQIIVSIDIGGKQQTFAPVNFRVRAVPAPMASFANVQGEGAVGKGALEAQDACFAALKDFDFDLRFTVTEFTLTFNDKGFDVSEPSTSNRITDKQRALVKRLTRGKKLYVEKVKAVGPGNKSYELAPIIITVN
jgi:gliding motility-associated protein GldM